MGVLLFSHFRVTKVKLIYEKNSVKMAPTVEKTEVFKKCWNFANRTYFTSCIMKKHQFLLWTKKNNVLSLFLPWHYFLQRWAIDCPVNFKFYLNIFIFLNINTFYPLRVFLRIFVTFFRPFFCKTSHKIT